MCSVNLHVFEKPVQYEIDLVKQWLLLTKGARFISITGEDVIIVNPGTLNKHEGPDIENAILIIGRKIKFGSIECHINASGWYAHHHHNNSNYNDVILHVVRKINFNSQYPDIPTIELEQSQIYANDCSLSIKNLNENLNEIIYNYSHKRWQRRMSAYNGFHKDENHFRKLLIKNSFAILGAGGNRDQFLTLANCINIDNLSEFDTIDIENYLTKTSIEKSINWKKRGIRPFHQPQIRMKLAAELIKYFISFDLNAFNDFTDIKSDFIERCPSANGKGIQTELWGNVNIPFIASRYLFINDIKRYSQYYKLWNELKLPNSYNKYSKRLKELIPSSELKRFPILQGLKEIDRENCSPKNCNLCPLKNNYGYFK